MLWVSPAVFPPETEFDTNYMVLYSDSILNVTREQHLITKLVLKTKQNITSTWNKVACVCNGQDARSDKQRIM
jgi:hypothetical protein